MSRALNCVIQKQLICIMMLVDKQIKKTCFKPLRDIQSVWVKKLAEKPAQKCICSMLECTRRTTGHRQVTKSHENRSCFSGCELRNWDITWQLNALFMTICLKGQRVIAEQCSYHWVSKNGCLGQQLTKGLIEEILVGRSLLLTSHQYKMSCSIKGNDAYWLLHS